MKTQTVAQQVSRRDFSKKTLSALARKGISVESSQWAPGADGTYANGETVYALVVKGCQYLRTHSQVITCAASSWAGES